MCRVCPIFIQLAVSAVFSGMSVFAQDVPVDETVLECRFDLRESRDTIGNRYADDRMILKIGKESSLFYSYYRYYADSLLNSESGARIIKEEILTAIRSGNPLNGPGARTTSDYLYKNYPEGYITTRTLLMTSYVTYTEPYEEQNWILCDSVKYVLEYCCQKAMCIFRGREYVAWFAPQIPIREGPWKFHGLPGLIMEVYDSGNHYHYTATELKVKDSEPVVLYDNPHHEAYQKTTRIKYLRRKAAFYFQMNPQDVNVLIGIDLKGDKPAGRMPAVNLYDFMERDYK